MRKLGFVLIFMVFSFSTVLGIDALKKGDTLRRQKKYDEARQAYLEIGKQSADPAQFYLARFKAAQCLIDKKDYKAFGDEAGVLLKEIPQRFFDLRAEVELTSESLLILKRRWKSTETGMAAFASSHPGTIWAVRAQAYQAEALGKQKKYNQARELFFRISSECNNTSLALEARHQAANLLFDAEKYLEFEKEAITLMDQKPPQSNRYVEMTKFLLAKCPDTQGRPLESAQRFEALSAENKNNHFEHHCAMYYMKAANEFDRTNKKTEAQECFAKAHEYFKKERTLIENRIQNKKLKPDDYQSRFAYLESYYLENDNAGLADQALKLCTEFPKPTKLWAAGMYWYGISKYSQIPRDYNSAAAAFDEVLEANVIDKDLSNHLPTQVAVWRATIAAEQKDNEAFSAAVERIKKMPNGSIKKEALKRLNQKLK